MLTKVGDVVSMIDTEALGQREVVAAYLIEGKERALIDMGYRSSAGAVMQNLLDHDMGRVQYLLPTHVHLDHAGSCGTLAKKFPDAVVLAHPKGVNHLIDPSKLVGATTELFGRDLMQEYGLPEPIDQSSVRSIIDDSEIQLGSDVTLRAVWTPGHASHHISYQIEETRDVFTGDAVGIFLPGFPVLFPTTPPTSFNLELATESLTRIRDLRPSRLFTPHFGVVQDAAKAIDDNIRSLTEWKDAVEPMIAAGISADKVTDAQIRKLCGLVGRSPESIPEHLRISIRLNVLGLERYLKKAAGRSVQERKH